MDDDKLLEALQGVKQAIQEDQSIVARFDEHEKKSEEKFAKIEERLDQYSIFISKTSGSFTRIGFYLDALVLYLRGLWKKGG